MHQTSEDVPGDRRWGAAEWLLLLVLAAVQFTHIVDFMIIMPLCPQCREERQLPSLQHFRCPVCGTPTPDVVRGRELELTALEISENAVQDR